MPFVRKLIPTLLMVTLLSSVTGSPVRAETPQPQQATLRCVDGACTVQIPAADLPPLVRLGATLGWSALQGRADTLPAGANLKIDSQLTLTLPVGELVLPKAQLAVEMGDDNRIARLHGVVETPFPTLGVLSDVRMVQPALAEVGLDIGANLGRLAAPLDPARQYLFFNIASGMDVTGKIADTGDALSLSAPAGQVLTLVIDTQEPLVYLAGNVTVNTSGEMLLAGPLQELAQQSALIPDSLPLRQRTQVTVAGLAGKHTEESFKLGGAWSVDSGALGRWLGVEATPLAVEGLLTLSADGMLLHGVVCSSIAPDKVLDSSAQMTAFIPFRKGAQTAFVEIHAAAAIPLAKIDVDGGARLDLPRIESRAVVPALNGWLAALRQQAGRGAQAVQSLTARGNAWLAALPELHLGGRIETTDTLAQH